MMTLEQAQRELRQMNKPHIKMSRPQMCPNCHTDIANRHTYTFYFKEHFVIAGSFAQICNAARTAQ